MYRGQAPAPGPGEDDVIGGILVMPLALAKFGWRRRGRYSWWEGWYKGVWRGIATHTFKAIFFMGEPDVRVFRRELRGARPRLIRSVVSAMHGGYGGVLTPWAAPLLCCGRGP